MRPICPIGCGCWSRGRPPRSDGEGTYEKKFITPADTPVLTLDVVTVKLRQESREAGRSSSVEGRLLAHVDRFWYVFDKRGILIALPDEGVTEVRISL